MTKEEFLLDTIKYYSEDVNRRCESDGFCAYSGKTINKNSEGCAIGRWLDEELKLKLDALGPVSVNRDEVFAQLPEWMKVLGKDFLNHVQKLHDNKHNWNKEGLSKFGEDNINYIINNYKLNIPLYE